MEIEATTRTLSDSGCINDRSDEDKEIASTGAARLVPCSPFPNCVSTVAGNWIQAIAPMRYQGSLAAAKADLLEAMYSIPRATLVKEETAYFHVEYRSKLFEFVDDVEVVFDEQAREIHFRAAARLGKWDFGINRRRMEKIRRAFEARVAARSYLHTGSSAGVVQ